MSKAIKFEYEGKEYTLTFTKRTVQELEAKGFSTNKVDDMQMTMLPMLFHGAFLAKHRMVKPDVIEAIYKLLPDKPALWSALGELYNDPLMELAAEPGESEKKVEWKMEG